MQNKERGFIAKILIVVVAIIFIKYYFRIDIIGWFQSGAGRSVWEPVWNLFVKIYMWLDVLVRGWVS